MQTVQEMKSNSEVNVSDVAQLQNILMHSQAVISIPDLETLYCRLPHSDHSAMELKDQSISTIITEQQQELDVISHETLDRMNTVKDRMKNLRQQLVDKQDKITEPTNMHKGLASALQRLPAEILSEIFGYYLLGSGHLSRTSEPSPMLLARVCRRWRDVAVGMAKLWCKLSFYVDDDRRAWKRAAFYYDSWLKQSRECPLSLQLHPGYAKGGTTKLRHLLRPYMNRVSSLDIMFGNDIKPKRLLADLPAALQELTICFDDCFDASAISQSLSRLPSTVRKLKIRERTFGFDCLNALNPVWAHLTHVEIAVRPRNVLHFLRLCPNLSSCEVILDQPFRSMKIQPFPFTHANLQSLRIICPGNVASNPLPKLVNALTLPKLRALEIRHAFLPSPDVELRAFLVRSHCPLEILIFDAVVIPPLEQHGEFIGLVPSLQVGYRLDTTSLSQISQTRTGSL